MEVRRLKVGDIFTVSKILNKVSRSVLAQLAAAVGDKADDGTVALSFVTSLLSDAGDEITAWLGDLCGRKADEFRELPAAAVIDVIEALKRQEDIRDFLGRVSGLVSTAARKTG